MKSRGKEKELFGMASAMGVLLTLLFFLPTTTVMAGNHDGLTTYQGSKTCNPCHLDKSKEVHGSVHYQLKGMTPNVPDLGYAGKLGQTNDFCTYPNINWLFRVTKVDGSVADSGCAACHVGMGLVPSREQTGTQLENIDCLMCHSDIYKRKLRQVNQRWRFVPDPAVDIAQVLAGIHLPTKATCLKCHANSGGGSGVKQGDISPALADPPMDLDVHMSSSGQGFNCTECHKVRQHKIAGRGNDLRATDLLSPKVTCTMCHNAQPHGDADLDRHTARVNCTVCHIPTFARGLPTDIFRDFSKVEVDPVKGLYEPVRTLGADAVPVYRFFNGHSYFYPFGTPLSLGAGNTMLLAGPIGDINDPGAKIHAFKFHGANMPYDVAGMRLLPVKAKILWQTGDIDLSVRTAASNLGWPLTNGYAYVKTDRYMALYHSIPPKSNALQCAECHNGGSRIDFDALGYTPKVTVNGVPLCSSCHGSESASFDRTHSIHVDKEGFECSRCHNF